MRIVYYNSLTQRKQLLDAATKLGETSSHDDFVNSSGKNTDGTKGRLTFEVYPELDQTKFKRMKLLGDKLKDNSITFEEVKEYLRE